jgi:hypothetical protein
VVNVSCRAQDYVSFFPLHFHLSLLDHPPPADENQSE